MNWRTYSLLFILGLAVAVGVASLQSAPGYLDSEYYFVGGLQLVKGAGFSEPFLWNYLDDPAGIPHPSHTYWQPFASILAAVSMFVSGQHTYAGARLIFILISACIPPLTAYLALEITGRRLLAVTSGMLAVFSVYYLPFMPVTDNYAPFMLLGGLIFVLAKRNHWWASLLMGALAGLMTLARSDGLLWLGLVGLLPLWRSSEEKLSLQNKSRTFVLSGLLAVFGFMLVMGPWYARNLATFGAPMAPGGNRILWLTNYDDTFAFPADQVNREAWLAAGWQAAFEARLWALRMNLLNAFGAQGGILLFPFILLGLWDQRHDVRAKMAVTGWLLLLSVLTLLFPFTGARGGFFHAGAAFQTYWWVLAALGLSRLVDALYRRHILTAEHAGTVFQGLLVVVCVLLSGVIVQLRILQSGWQPDADLYPKVEHMLVEQGAKPGEAVIVRDPAGYYLASERPTLAMPPGGPESILALSARYGASYFILEPGGVLAQYRQIYEQFESNSGLEYIGEVDGARIYALHPAR